MHKNEYQGGCFFEIFDPSVKDPLINCKIVGAQAIQKMYEKNVKGSVYQLDGSPTTTKICLPKDSRQALSLIQRYLVLQLEIRQSHDFSLEIGISDLSQTKRNLFFSTSHKDLNVQPLSARVPIKLINRKQWTNVVFDVAAFVSDIWKNQTFKAIESITICANCRLRKIFTIKNAPINDHTLSLENAIMKVEFPNGIDCKVQLLNLNEIRTSEGMLDASLTTTVLNQNEAQPLDTSMKLKKTLTPAIAFGTKVPSATSRNTHTSALLFKQQQQVESNDHLTKTQINSTSNSKVKLNETQGSLSKPLSAKSVRLDEKKLPHPPQTSRPAQSPARNVRISLKSLKTKFIDQMNETIKATNEPHQIEFDVHDNKQDFNERKTSVCETDSINDLIHTLNLKKSDETHEHEQIYQFSSQPKVTSTSLKGSYDHNKYAEMLSPLKSIHVQPVQEELMDSFEAKMLMEMKEEMEQNSSHSKKAIKKEKLYCPLAFQLKQDTETVSEKYNFEVFTNSVDSIETSESVTNESKKNKNVYKKDNYQDEMNVVSIEAANSIANLKDAFYLKASKINEENKQQMDSQATDMISDEQASEDEEIDLLYDPTLNCYYDPTTGIYYETM